MRRQEREIKDRAAIDALIREGRICRLGLCDGDEPYVVPLCYGYDGTSFYFHAAQSGRKLEILRRNPKVCVEIDVVRRTVEAEQACDWGLRYQSVIAQGVATILEDPAEKKHGLAVLMAQFAPGKTFVFPDAAVAATAVIRVRIDRISGKQRLD